MAEGARISLQNWGRRLGRSCITGLTGRGSSRSVSTHVQGKGALLEKSFVLSSLSVLAIGAYRWKSRHAVIYASIKVEDVKEEADYLYGAAETEKLYELLSQYGDSTDAEILWRLARASRDLAQLSKTPPDDKKRLVYEAREFAKKALEINESCSAAHKWYAICLSDVGDYEGMKVKIGNAYIIRDHFQRAIELNPNDATTIHLIGVWSGFGGFGLGYTVSAFEFFQGSYLGCYTFADLPWYQNKIAAALFATPPSSTFDEALIYFEMAEEVDPNFYSKNLLYLGKTFLKLKNNELALQWLQKAKDYPVRTEEDKAVYKEATDILKSYGVKV